MTRIRLTDREQIFDIAFSFVGKDRELVSAIASIFVSRGVYVFYDKYYEDELIGQDLVTYFRDIYANKSRFCAIFISKEFSSNRWTNIVERPAILDKATRSDNPYLLPVLLDDSWIEGLPTSIGFLDGRDKTTEEIADSLYSAIGGGKSDVTEMNIFWTLACDYKILGQFIYLFGKNDKVEKFNYQLYDYIRKLIAFSQFLATYGLCEYDTNYPDEPDVYLEARLTKKGKGFRDYISRHLMK